MRAIESENHPKMATSTPSHTWQNGFRQPTKQPLVKESPGALANGEVHYISPPSQELPTSTVSNSLGNKLLRTWATLYDGTESPHGLPSWWNPSKEVDVLIVGGLIFYRTPLKRVYKTNGCDRRTNWSRNSSQLATAGGYFPNLG